MIRRISLPVAALTTAGAIATSLALGSGAANAAPLTVQQVPALGTAIGGLLLPFKVESRVVAQSTADPQQVRFSAPAGPSACAATFNKALIHIDWRNQANGRTGRVTVKPCDVGYNPGFLTEAVANTGIGRIAFTQVITGSLESPTAGLPSTPGGGTVLR